MKRRGGRRRRRGGSGKRNGDSWKRYPVSFEREWIVVTKVDSEKEKKIQAGSQEGCTWIKLDGQAVGILQKNIFHANLKCHYTKEHKIRSFHYEPRKPKPNSRVKVSAGFVCVGQDNMILLRKNINSYDFLWGGSFNKVTIFKNIVKNNLKLNDGWTKGCGERMKKWRKEELDNLKGDKYYAIFKESPRRLVENKKNSLSIDRFKKENMEGLQEIRKLCELELKRRKTEGSSNEKIYGFPKGSCDLLQKRDIVYFENDLVCALRELNEETGKTLKKEDIDEKTVVDITDQTMDIEGVKCFHRFFFHFDKGMEELLTKTKGVEYGKYFDLDRIQDVLKVEEYEAYGKELIEKIKEKIKLVEK